MTIDYWAKVKKDDPAIISGWNCLEENQSVWLENKICKIKDVDVNDTLHKYGIIKHFAETGIKNEHEILLSTGQKINCSGEHKFPFYQKGFNNYKDYKSLLKTEQEKSINDIIKIRDTNDIFLKIEKHKNINKDLTLRDLIINNFKIFKQYEFFNFIISDTKIYDHIYKNDSRRLKLRTQNFWKKNINKYSFKELKNKVPESMIIDFIKNNNDIWFLFTKEKNKININQKINNDLLQVLGLIYTDGCFSYNEYVIYNTNDEILNKYEKIINTNLRVIKKSKYSRTLQPESKDFKTNKKVYKLRFGRKNIIMLLYPLIYHNSKVKNISLELCSQLSFKQFQYLFSGMIDGDGSVRKEQNAICLCNYESEIESNINNISELLIWNGVIPSFSSKNNLYINCSQYTKSFINGLNFYHDEKKKRHSELKFKIIKNHKSNKIKIQELDRYALIRIKDIYQTGRQVQMYDIETTKHLFNSSHGIVTHNSHMFDYPYLYYYLLNNQKGNHKKVAKQMSNFGTVKVGKKRDRAGNPVKVVSPVEYPVCDLLYCYAERSDGGCLSPR